MLKKFYFAVLLFLFLHTTGNAQPVLKQLERAYTQNSIHSKEACLLDIIKTEDLAGFQNEIVQQIMLIRHGQPLLSKEGLFSSFMAKEYSYLYDQVEVKDFDKSPICIKNQAIDTILSSNLRRAVNTAEKIIEERDIVLQSESLFREFEREVFLIPFIRLPLNFWLVISRAMWYARLNTSNIEGISSANSRVSYAAKYLEFKAKTNNPVILVAHGMFNKALSKKLKKRGWSLVYSNGHGYLNVRILARKTP